MRSHPLPSRGGAGVGSVISVISSQRRVWAKKFQRRVGCKEVAAKEWQQGTLLTLQTPPLTPPLEGRGWLRIELREGRGWLRIELRCGQGNAPASWHPHHPKPRRTTDSCASGLSSLGTHYAGQEVFLKKKPQKCCVYIFFIIFAPNNASIMTKRPEKMI